MTGRQMRLLSGLVCGVAVAMNLSLAWASSSGGAAAHGVTRFLFDSRSSQQEAPRVFSMAPDASGGVHPVAPPGSRLGAVSPDGRHIVYWELTQTGARLVVADSDGKDRRNVTPVKGFAYQPDWSPDGRSLAFGRGPGGRGTGLYTATAAGRHVRPIPHTSEGTAPRYFPDGNRVVYMRGLNPCCQLYVIGVDGSGKRAVAGGRLAGFPDVSPDGTTLVFELSRRSGSASVPDGLAVQPAAGGPVVRLPAAGKCAKSPRWAPDGAVIFFVRCQRTSTGQYRFGHDSLAEVNSDGTGLHVLIPKVVEASDLRWIGQAPPAQTPTPTPTATGSVASSSAAPTSEPSSSAGPEAAHSAGSDSDHRVPVMIVAAALAALVGVGHGLAQFARG